MQAAQGGDVAAWLVSSVSTTSGTPRVAGDANRAANASARSSRAPIDSCRSRFEPAGSRLSLTCTSRDRPGPAPGTRAAAAASRRRGQVMAGGVQVAGVQADADRASRPSASRYGPRSSTPDASARPPGGRLDQQRRARRAPRRAREQWQHAPAPAPARPRAVPGDRRAGVHDDAARARPGRAAAQRERQRARPTRLQGLLGRRAEVDQVRRVHEDRHRPGAPANAASPRRVRRRRAPRRAGWPTNTCTDLGADRRARGAAPGTARPPPRCARRWADAAGSGSGSTRSSGGPCVPLRRQRGTRAALDRTRCRMSTPLVVTLNPASPELRVGAASGRA